MTSIAAYAALRRIEDLLAAGIRPHAVSIAAHYGVTSGQLKTLLMRARIKLPAGRMSAEQIEAFAEACPRIPLILRRATHAFREPRTELPEGMPDEVELEDACAQWGIAGAAEEYEVSEDQICAWLRAHGEASELNRTMVRRKPAEVAR